MHFTQIVQYYNSAAYQKIDFISELGYILFIPSELSDLLYNDYNIIMSSDYLNRLGLEMPYTTISVDTNQSKDSINDLLKSFIKYKGNSTLDYYSKPEQIKKISNLIFFSSQIVLLIIAFLILNIRIVLTMFLENHIIEYRIANPISFIDNGIKTKFLVLEILAFSISINTMIIIHNTDLILFLSPHWHYLNLIHCQFIMWKKDILARIKLI